MAGFKRNLTTGDLDMTNGLQIVYGREDNIQRILLGLSINLGEFFTHINYGLPWIKNKDVIVAEDILYFMGGDINVTAQYVVNELDRYIRSLDFVGSLESNYEFNRATRTLRYFPTIRDITGEILDFPPYLQQLQG